MKKPIIITSLIFLMVFVIVALFGPYSYFFYSMNEVSVRERFVGEDHKFRGEKVTDINYKGEHSFYIETKGEDFIVIQDYWSFMNYEWVVMKEVARKIP